MLDLPPSLGEPTPDMPGTLLELCLLVLLPLAGSEGRDRAWATWSALSLSWRLSAGSDWWAIDGGVTEPLDGAVPWLTAPSLDVSVEASVRKLALDRRRSSLKNLGAIANENRGAGLGGVFEEWEGAGHGACAIAICRSVDNPIYGGWRMSEQRLMVCVK